VSMSRGELEKVVSALDTARKLQRGAWDRVQNKARQWAMLKAHGVYINEHGHSVRVSSGELDTYERVFRSNLLQEVEQAFAEDALMGIAVSNNLN
jgi:hypothetical protein